MTELERNEQIADVLDQLEELIPQLERTRRDMWLTRFRNSMAFLAAGAFIIAGIALVRVGSVARHDSTRATVQAERSDQLSQCINNLLGDRAPRTAANSAAALAFYAAEKADAKAFGTLLTDILSNAPTSKSTPDFLAYIKVHSTLISVSEATYKTLETSQEYYDKHPLGRC